MKIELSKFRVKKGMEVKALEWMDYLRIHIDAVIQTLEGEKMYVETIFSEQDDDYMYLYWYSIQGEGGIEVIQSEHEVDKKHIEYWKACIDAEYKPVHMKQQVSMIPNRVLSAF